MEKERKLGLEDIVPEYRSSFFLVRNLFIKKLEKCIGLVKDDLNSKTRILDIGCGEGILEKELRKKTEKGKIYGVDFNINTDNLNKLHLKNCRFMIGDATKLKFRKNYFDIVFAIDILEHIKDAKKALKEIKRVLKDKGVLILSGPTESIFQKLARFLVKGAKGPGAGVHYHNVYGLKKIIEENNFKKAKSKKLPFMRIIKFRSNK